MMIRAKRSDVDSALALRLEKLGEEGTSLKGASPNKIDGG